MSPAWWVFIILIILLYLILGTFLTPSEIILVTVPVLLPVSTAVGIHPIHFGMVCVIASAVGHITPVLASIVVTLLLIAFMPGLVLFLPRLLGFTQ